MLPNRALAAFSALVLAGSLLVSCSSEPGVDVASTAGTVTGVSVLPPSSPPAAPGSDSSESHTEPTAGVGTSSPPLAQCAAEPRSTVTSGFLTIAAPDDAEPPWYEDRDPATGNGFEAALGYALAGRLGFRADRVHWAAVDRQMLAAGAGSGYDLAAAELTAPDLPDGSVDYSTGYLDAPEALAVADHALAPMAADPETLPALRIGVVIGSAADSELQSFSADAQPQGFDTTDELLTALTGGMLDVAAVNMIDALGAGTVIAGTFPVTQGQPRQLSLVLPQGSPWTGCVSSVLDSMRADGFLDELTAGWIGPLPELSR